MKSGVCVEIFLLVPHLVELLFEGGIACVDSCGKASRHRDAMGFHSRDEQLAEYLDPGQIRVAKLGGAQGLPEFAGIQIETEQGKPLMAILQRNSPGLEVDPLRIQILAGQAGDADIRIAQRLEKLRIPTARGNVPVRHEWRERRRQLLQPPEQRRPKRLADRTGEAEENAEFWGGGHRYDLQAAF